MTLYSYDGDRGALDLLNVPREAVTVTVTVTQDDEVRAVINRRIAELTATRERAAAIGRWDAAHRADLRLKCLTGVLQEAGS